MKKINHFLIVIVLFIIFGLFSIKSVNANSFDPNNLISDGEFININSMSVGDIQNFLNEKGGFLKDYSEGGRSAAQIIYDASHGHGEASGPPPNGCYAGICINTTTGTINPKVILVTLQKEQSLLTMKNYSEAAMNTAMGYGCPDSGGCDPKYKGFTNQVEWASWQFRFNYERAQGLGASDYQVGQTYTFNDWNGSHTVTLGNRATASLYRYTPHVYNGNYNFWSFYNSWFIIPKYASAITHQNGYTSLDYGESYNFIVKYRNMGSVTWTKDKVFLGTSGPRDRISQFLREGGNPSGWISQNRIEMQQSSVAPGEEATFSFWMKAPSNMAFSQYKEQFQLVVDGVQWMEDHGMHWIITVPRSDNLIRHQWVSQSAYPTINQGQSTKLTLKVKNTGTITWEKGKVNLGTDRNTDRITQFVRSDIVGNTTPTGWLSQNRIIFEESSVAPGQEATFSFWISASNDMTPGKYKEYFRLVSDGITWMEDYGIHWEVTVNPK